jgi:hypothetical protein
MGIGFRSAAVALALTSASLVSLPARAGDDGAAPLWQGIGSIFSPVIGPAVGFGFGGEKPPPIEYREHGKLVLPPNTDLPPPGSSATADPAWPVNQEVLRRKALKEEEKQKAIAGVGDARLRYTHGFPANEPVTVRSVTPDGQIVKSTDNSGSDSSPLGNLNPLSWVGMGKHVPLGPEPDREWLTDPPKGFRAPVAPEEGTPKPAQGSAQN